MSPAISTNRVQYREVIFGRSRITSPYRRTASAIGASLSVFRAPYRHTCAQLVTVHEGCAGGNAGYLEIFGLEVRGNNVGRDQRFMGTVGLLLRIFCRGG